MKRKPPIWRALDEAAGPEHEFCLTCLGPHQGAHDLPPLVLEKGDPIPACSACGEVVYPDGRSAVSVGQVSPPIIVLARSTDDFDLEPQA